MNNANFSKTFLIWKPMFKINQIWIERKQDSKQHHYRKTPICHNTVYKLSLWLHLWVAVIKLPLIDNIHVLHVFNDAIFPEGFSKPRIRISIHLSSQIYAFKHVWGFETKALWTDRWKDGRMDGPSYDTLPGSMKFGFHHHFEERFKKQENVIIKLLHC